MYLIFKLLPTLHWIDWTLDSWKPYNARETMTPKQERTRRSVISWASPYWNCGELYQICQVVVVTFPIEIITWIISLGDLIFPREKTDQTGGTVRLSERERERDLLLRKKLFSRNEAVIRQRYGIMEEEEYDDFNFTWDTTLFCTKSNIGKVSE